MSTLWENKTQLVWANGEGYSWTQTVEEVQIKIPVTKGTTGKQINFKLEIKKLTVGLKGEKPIIDGELFNSVIPKDSFWTLEDNELIYIQLQKIKRHDSWPSVLAGVSEIDPFTKQEMDKKMMLEKFQRENPGFDFSGANFSGNLPQDPATFGDDWKNN